MTYSSLGAWCRYVAVGDSFTEGLCDEDPTRPGRHLGWADRLAAQLAVVHETSGFAPAARPASVGAPEPRANPDPVFRYANLAIRLRQAINPGNG